MLPLVVVLSIPTSLHLGRGAEAAGPASVPFLIASRVYMCYDTFDIGSEETQLPADLYAIPGNVVENRYYTLKRLL